MTRIIEKPPRAQRPNLAAGIVARALQIALIFVVIGAVLFLAAGRMDWTWAWVMLAVYLASVVVNSYFMRNNPETVAERGQPGEMKRWDQVISGLWSLAQFVLVPLVAGLDVRFGLTPELAAAWHLAGALAFAAGLGLFGWAMITNAYFSTVVRIQADRGQTVCRDGPYRWVRHPGYVGAIVQSLAMVLLLGSAWALVPGLAAAALMVTRTALEDRALQAELPGYREFAQDVRYRLLPGVW
jgi:protein-S-isoprenylcysteine O-methyltransferase Ste14